MKVMIKSLILLFLITFLPFTTLAADNNIDISGDWVISSSVGGEIPITVNCTLIQLDESLSGTCTPVMDAPEPSELTGVITASSASWGYKVIFNGNPGTVDFMADTISNSEISGILSLSGATAPFKAIKE